VAARDLRQANVAVCDNHFRQGLLLTGSASCPAQLNQLFQRFQLSGLFAVTVFPSTTPPI